MAISEVPDATHNPERRTFLAQASAGAALLAAGTFDDGLGAGRYLDKSRRRFQEWFLAGRHPLGDFDFHAIRSRRATAQGDRQPVSPVDFPDSVPSDPATNTWFAYGYREGIPRMLDLWDRHDVKVTSHMIGEAARRQPSLAREIVARGHEAAGHGPRWSSQFAMSREEERTFLRQAAQMVQEVTGQPVTGYNCNWLRRGPNTLALLQELGYLYHIDDVSRDEPFIESVNGKDFAVVPYTLRNNDIVLIEGRHYSPQAFLEQVKLDFDQLYEEAGTRRRMMSISAHDRISGTPQMVRVWDEFLRYAKSHPGVTFMRKDDIARYTLASALSVREAETL